VVKGESAILIMVGVYQASGALVQERQATDRSGASIFLLTGSQRSA
jgi:hypothetical protein